MPIEVPSTSIYSRSDGVVACAPACCRKVRLLRTWRFVGSHVGLGVHAPVLYAIADRLAQRESAWKPFRPPWALRAMYPDPHRTTPSEH
jgi:hypothetical protein